MEPLDWCDMSGTGTVSVSRVTGSTGENDDASVHDDYSTTTQCFHDDDGNDNGPRRDDHCNNSQPTLKKRRVLKGEKSTDSCASSASASLFEVPELKKEVVFNSKRLCLISSPHHPTSLIY